MDPKAMPRCASCRTKACCGGKDCFGEADRHRALYEDQQIAPLHKAASAIEGLAECHDLTVLEDGDELLIHVHCESDPALTVQQAHALSQRLERAMQTQLGDSAEVVIHIEPRAQRNV